MIQVSAGWANLIIPVLSGRVVDQAHILGAGDIRRLTDELARYERETSTQIVVVTVADMQGYTIEDWGLGLLRGWGIGQKGKNNGIVLVVAPNDRKMRIETGYGAEGPLPDATASVIIRTILAPHFRQNDYAGGISAGITAIEQALAGSFTADEPRGEPVVSANGVAILGQHVPWMTLLFVSIWIAIVVANLLRAHGNGSRIYTGDRRRDYWNSGSGGGFGGGGFGGGGSSGGGGFGGGGGSGGGGGASGGW